MDIEKEIKSIAPDLTKQILNAATQSNNEAEFRTKTTRLIEDFAQKVSLNLHLREEHTLINGRADAVYNRLVIEYEPPRSLRQNNSYRANQHAINQLKGYIEGLVRRERHKPERLAGVVLDGGYFIFIRSKEGVWHIDTPLKLDDYSTEYFLKLLASLSTELALIPENLIKDFGENTTVSRKIVSSLLDALIKTSNPKVKTLFDQWSLQFSEVCDYEEASKLKIESFARKFGVDRQRIQPFHFFFCLHTYYATFIKLLAVQVVLYYAMPKFGTDLKRAATLSSEELMTYLNRMEDGGIFKELGISNFLEGDFFSWYLDVWDDNLYQSYKTLISNLANYSLVTLDVDPDTTRDLLKKLYQQLMPKELRHNLGEYYTPDWLAERLLGMLCGWRKEGDKRVPDIKPDYRILDPGCGSGTFLVLCIKRIKEYAQERMLPESDVLEKILNNIVGFDLNPLAVISARTNYLLALGDLLQHRTGNVSIPVYICDSIITPHEGEDLYSRGIMRFNTAVGPFSLSKSLVHAQYIDKLANFLEDAVRLNFTKEQFVSRLTSDFPILPEKDSKDIEVVFNLYEKLLSLEKQGINGIWARIIKNAFAPLFIGEFDYIAGNPPWVNWESLPEQYRLETKPLWIKYGLFPHGGMDTILGKGKKDISMIMTYVAIDKYLKKSGKLGFVITQSIFKTSGAGQGFRKFQIGDKGLPIQVIHVDDMVKLNPFEGASNRTSVVILQKGRPTKYPMPSYLYWKKTVKGKSVAIDSELEDVLSITERRQLVAEPINANDITSSWITGKPKALKAIRKILGQSDYEAREGVNSGGANAVYWVEIVTKRPDELVVISNITERIKRKIESIQSTIEPDLLYPLLRGRDVKRWKVDASAYIIMTQDPIRRRGIEEDVMKTRYPKTYLYLKKFENVLRERSVFKRYFTRKSKDNRIIETGAFYSMFGVGNYTFSPYKVVWREVSHTIDAAVTEKKNNKPTIPDHTLVAVDCVSLEEAHYICALLNSTPYRFGVHSYIVLHPDPHILQNIRIPKFDPKDKHHLQLTELSEKAHEIVQTDGDTSEIEDQIDELAAEIWGLTKEELREIKTSLGELA
ncbi:MAG: N-6 DNA methylase [Nitrospirota bacterium]